MHPVKFDHNIEQLQLVVAESQKIDETKTEEEIAEMRKKVVKIRGKIQSDGKDMRDEANKYRTLVLTEEKKLLEIITPEEDRLKKLEEQIKVQKIMEARKAALPLRKEALNKIGDGVDVSDETLLEMDDEAFTLYKAERITNLQEKKEEEVRRAEQEKQRLAELEAAKETARKEAEEKAKKEAEEAIKKAEMEKQAAEQKLKDERARAEREAKEAEEAKEKEEARLARETEYRKWLKDNSFDESTMKLINTEKEVQMYKLVATYTK